ncbi:MAG: hypothetical protein OHK0046_26840 [Anaerolineae bacterium]
MFTHLRSLAVRQLHSLEAKVRLVVIHPNYLQQHLILAEFLDKAALYVRFEGHKLSHNALKEQIETALHTQPAPETLLLDECDRAESYAIDSLLTEVLKALPNVRVILFSRKIPHCIVNNPEMRHQTAFIPTDSTAMLWDYALLDDVEPLVEVRALGEGRVLINGRTVDDWDGILPRSLFFYLIDRGMTTRNEIFETFWPNLPTREATNVFHVTKRKVSEVLGLDLTTYWSGFYRISSTLRLSYDVVLFTELLQKSAVAASDEAEEHLDRAIGLYQGHFLSSVDMEWAKKRRQELAQDYSDGLINLAKTKEKSDHKQQALGLYLRAAAANQHREDLTHSIMKLYHEQGMHADALEAYNRLTTELTTDLGVKPGSQLQELAAVIRHAMT